MDCKNSPPNMYMYYMHYKHSSVSSFTYPSFHFLFCTQSPSLHGAHLSASGSSRGPAGPMAGGWWEGEGEHDGAGHARHPPRHPQFDAAGPMTCAQKQQCFLLHMCNKLEYVYHMHTKCIPVTTSNGPHHSTIMHVSKPRPIMGSKL